MNFAGTTLAGGQWVAIANDAMVSTPAWPLLASGIAVVAGICGSVLFVAAAFREGRGMPALGVGLAVVSAIAGAFILLFPAFIRPGEIALDAQNNAHDAYGQAVAVGGAGLGGVVAVLGLAAAVWLGGPRRDAVGIAGAAALVGACSLGAVVAAEGHAAWLLWDRTLPILSTPIGPRIHVGPSFEVPVKADGVEAPWLTDPLVIRPVKSGRLAFELAAWQAGPLGLDVRVSRLGAVEVGEPVGSPAMPLAVGNVWSFEAVTSWRSQYLWFISDDHEVTDPGPVLRIEAEEQRLGRKMYVVSRAESDGNRRSWTVYPWNGKTLIYDALAESRAAEARKTHIDETLPAVEDEVFAWFDAGLASQDAGGAWVGTCGLAAFPDASCTCYSVPPGGRVPISGPASCRETQSSGGSTFSSVLLAIVTVGLIIEDPDREVVYVVTEAEAEAGGREAP